MSNIERTIMVKAMNYIACNLTDEEILYDEWLVDGVADNDIEYGNVAPAPYDDENLAYYIEDANFADLMGTFLHAMKRAYKSGGLFCDGIFSKAKERSHE